MRNRSRIILLVVALLALPVVPTAAVAQAEPEPPDGVHSDNMSHVTNIAYEQRYGQTLPYGTDIEFASIARRRASGLPGPVREYAFAGTYRNGLQIIDITNPESPTVATVYDCALAQGDIQVFTQGQGRNQKTLVAYTADDIARETFPESGCYSDLGITTKEYGTFLVDVTNPLRPRTLGFAELDAGSHNQSVHPGGNFMYNSNADLLAEGIVDAAIEIFDISDPTDPVLVGELPTAPGLESHDITFNEDGSRAYSASLDTSLIIDSSDPANPEIIFEFADPAINIHHQADPVTIDDPVLGERDFLVITDELAGALPAGFCPGGGLHVYDITNETVPFKVGVFFIDEVRAAPEPGGDSQDRISTCTSHVLRMHADEKIMTIAWYNAGVRVIDISGLAGAAVGSVGAGMREIGFYRFTGDSETGSPSSDTWSFKTNKFEADGSFYGYGNDIARGLDVYRFEADEPQATSGGDWLTPRQALKRSKRLGTTAQIGANNSLLCLLPRT